MTKPRVTPRSSEPDDDDTTKRSPARAYLQSNNVSTEILLLIDESYQSNKRRALDGTELDQERVFNSGKGDKPKHEQETADINQRRRRKTFWNIAKALAGRDRPGKNDNPYVAGQLPHCQKLREMCFYSWCYENRMENSPIFCKLTFIWSKRIYSISLIRDYHYPDLSSRYSNFLNQKNKHFQFQLFS